MLRTRSTSGKVQRTVNAKLLFRALAGICIVATALHLLHSHQMQRNACTLARQAQKALEQQDYAKAADLFQSYLDYQPDDTDAMALYAIALDHDSSSPQTRFKTYLLLEQVLRRQPDRQELRRLAVQAAIDVGNLPDAIRHLEYMLTSTPKDGALEHRLGWCEEALGHYEASAARFRRAIALAPGQIESYVLLADLLARRLNQADEAAEVMDALTAANPASWQAYLARARFQYGKGRLDLAAADVFKASALAPEQAEVLLAAAEVALMEANLVDARNYVNRGLQLHPKNEQLYRSLATLEIRCDHGEEAITCLDRGLIQLPDSVPLHIQLAEVSADQGHASEALKQLQWVASHADLQPGIVDYLEGRLLALDRKWSEAVDKLLSAKSKLGLGSEWTSNLCATLGKCYERRGELDQQMASYRDAVVLDPGNVLARLQLGKALLAARLPEEASLELRHLSLITNPPRDTWKLLAQSLIETGQRRAPNEAAWKEIDTALKNAAAANPDDVALPCLYAERFLLQGDTAKAIATLGECIARRPDALQPRTALAAMQVKLGESRAALETLQQADHLFGPRLEIQKALTSYWLMYGGTKARAALGQLDQQAAALPADDRVLLLRDLANAVLRLGDKAQAEKVLRELATLLPKDLNSRVLLFDLFLNDHRDGESAALLSEIRGIDGEQGVLWRAGEAASGIAKAWQGDLSQLAMVRQRLEEIHKRRSDWGRAALLEGYVEEIDGHSTRAMESYRQAIDLGERPPAVVLRVAHWLADEQRFGDAGQVLRQLEDVMPLPREHARLAAEVALQDDEMKRALVLARKAVPPGSRDYRQNLWLANIQWLAGQPIEAQQTLREAVQAAPRVPDVWVALIHHLARTKLHSHLAEAFKEMQQQVPADRVRMARARCLEAAGQFVDAESAFSELLEANAGDFVATRQAAEFYLRNERPQKAEALLRRLLRQSGVAPSDVTSWARRQLAVVLASRQNTDDQQEALALTTPTGSPAVTPIEDDRVRAFVLANIGGRQAEAVQLFERTLPKQSLTPDERFLLAQVYDANRDTAKASRQMRNLLALHRDTGQYLAYYLQLLLDLGEAETGRSYLSLLEQLEPASNRTKQMRAAYKTALGGAER